MAPQHIISKNVLSEMHRFMDNQKQVGRMALPEEMPAPGGGAWLKDAAVIDQINLRQGAWDVSLVFAHYKNPLQFIVRHITRYFNKQKAQTAAFYIRKEAAKDRRGTLMVSITDLDLCNN